MKSPKNSQGQESTQVECQCGFQLWPGHAPKYCTACDVAKREKSSKIKYFDMQYLIIQPGYPPMYDNWFVPENCFIEGMTVIDLTNQVYMVDGVNWVEIEYNHL